MKKQIDKIGQDLTVKQQKLIECLLSNPTLSSAATCAGISRQTLHSWLNDSKFKAAYDSLRSQVFADNLSDLKGVIGESVETLRDSLTNLESSQSDKIRAAATLITLALKANESLEIEQRLTALESAQKGAF